MQTKLPSYMVPSQFVLLKQFPLTSNGKIDLRQLPAPDGSCPPGRAYVAPRNSDEQRVVEIWREVLSLNQVGIDDRFFEIGGDSLSATRAFARINRDFGMDLSLKEILEHPTVRLLAQFVSDRKGSSPSSLTPIPRQPRFCR
jgi:acyl carrier protein